jgi:hypothetical protein
MPVPFDISQCRSRRAAHASFQEGRAVNAAGFERIEEDTGVPALSISPEKVFYIIAKAREFDVKDVVTDPDSGSNAADDAMLSVLEDHSDDPVFDELTGFINALDEDEQVDLVALAWFGREDHGVEDWDELHEEASRAHNRHTARYLLGMPLLGDHLEEAISQFGHSHEDYEMGRR